MVTCARRSSIGNAPQRTPARGVRIARLPGLSVTLDAEDRVADAEADALLQRRQDAVDVVTRMIRLQARRQPPRHAERVVAVNDDADLLGGDDQIEVRHQLRARRDHLRRQPAREPQQLGARHRLVEHVLAQLGDGPVLDAVVDRHVQVVLDEPRDRVVVVGHDRIFAQLAQRHLRQH